MILLDAHLSPELAPWIATQLRIECIHLRDLGLRDAEDETVFARARSMKAVVMTKDSDFVELVSRLGPPPQVIWLTCGNTSNASLRLLLRNLLPQAMMALGAGEPLAEIGLRQ